MMHSSIKSGWRQTFALAKHNESEGRKSRIRHSKEERKAMVESFIKKYQESNNGNFPSLNLTHKEVGGSFYTVREIVRDIIQENRVLGPAKFSLEELNTDQFLEQNPLGSIARDPQPFLAASSNENHPEHNQVMDTNGKMLSVSDRHNTEAELQVVDKGHDINVGHVDSTNKEPIEATVVSDGYHTRAEHPVPVVDKGHVIKSNLVDGTNTKSVEATVVSDGHHNVSEHEIVDKGHVINHSQVGMTNKEFNKATIPETQVCEPMAPKQNVQQELTATTMPVAKVNSLTEDLIVEAFPLRSVARITDEIEGLGELRDSSNSPEKDIKMLELEECKKSELNGIEPTKNSDLLDEKFENALGNKKIKEISITGHDKDKNLRDMLAESENHSPLKEHSDHEFEGCTDPQVGASHQNAITSETIKKSQIKDGAKTSIQDGYQGNNLSKTYYTEGSKSSDEGLHKADKYGVGGQLGGNSQRRSNTTVDRINLESWDGTSKDSAKQERNPLLALLKAFAKAFEKFWSE